MLSKQDVRESVWNRLGQVGTIPYFDEAFVAALHLTNTWDEWRTVKRLVVGPDESMVPFWVRALQSGIDVFMAVPRLEKPWPFVKLRNRYELRRPEVDWSDEAAVKKLRDLAYHTGIRVYPELPHIDVIAGGSVAVDNQGNRVGKGMGFLGIERTILLLSGAVDPDVPVVTLVHSIQVVEQVPTDAHDECLAAYATEKGLVVINEEHRRQPPPVDLDLLRSRTSEIPYLRKLLG